jgi:hypothetical protein
VSVFGLIFSDVLTKKITGNVRLLPALNILQIYSQDILFFGKIKRQ